MKTQYGVITVGPSGPNRVQRQPTKGIAEMVARDWVVSPARSGPRQAMTVRRRDWDQPWETLDTWTTPESAEETA